MKFKLVENLLEEEYDYYTYKGDVRDREENIINSNIELSTWAVSDNQAITNIKSQIRRKYSLPINYPLVLQKSNLSKNSERNNKATEVKNTQEKDKEPEYVQMQIQF